MNYTVGMPVMWNSIIRYTALGEITDRLFETVHGKVGLRLLMPQALLVSKARVQHVNQRTVCLGWLVCDHLIIPLVRLLVCQKTLRY